MGHPILDADSCAAAKLDRIAAVRRQPPFWMRSGVVQAQVEAFNGRDVEGCVAEYAPDAIHWEYPADTVLAGAARIRAHYAELFTDPDVARLHAEVRSRIVKERFVIDEERVTGLPGEDVHVSVIVYEVVHGRIRNAWFMN